MSNNIKEASLTAQDTYTAWLQLSKKDFNVGISGTWAGTITVQKSYDNGITALDVEDLTANAQKTGFEPEGGVFYRAGFKTGNYTSGTAVIRLGH